MGRQAGSEERSRRCGRVSLSFLTLIFWLTQHAGWLASATLHGAAALLLAGLVFPTNSLEFPVDSLLITEAEPKNERLREPFAPSLTISDFGQESDPLPASTAFSPEELQADLDLSESDAPAAKSGKMLGPWTLGA